MRVNSFRPVAVGVAIAATALLSACGSQNPGAPASTVSASPENQAQQMYADGKDQKNGTDSTGKGVGDVNCSENGGKVGPEGGKQVDLIAVSTKAGRVGCTEAFNVITEYYRDAPTKSEGTAHALTVQGWKCLADTGAKGSGAIGCDKDGLSLHTAAVKDDRKFVNKTLIASLTGYDSTVDMVEFKLVKWVKGGANNGHYENLPEDPGTHRLPLAKSARILSVISICSTEITADSQGRAAKPCTKQQLVQKLNDSVSPFAELKVDGDDNITSVSELYTP